MPPALEKTLVLISFAAVRANDMINCADTVGGKCTWSPTFVQRKQQLVSNLAKEGHKGTPQEQHTHGGAALIGQKRADSERHRWKEQAGNANTLAASTTGKRGIASIVASVHPSSLPITTETEGSLERVEKRVLDAGVHLDGGQSLAADIEKPRGAHLDSSRARIKNSSRQQAGNGSEASEHVTSTKLARQAQRLGEKELPAAAASMSPGARRWWSLIAARAQVVMRDRLHRSAWDAVPVVLTFIGFLLILACVLLLRVATSSHLPLRHAPGRGGTGSFGRFTTDEDSSSGISSPRSVSESSERVRYAHPRHVRAGRRVTPHMSELIVPRNNECCLIVPRLSESVLKEPEAKLTIEDETGAPKFSISLTQTKPNRSKAHFDPFRGLRLSFCSTSGQDIFGYCEVELRSACSTNTGNRTIVSICGQDKRHFADIVHRRTGTSSEKRYRIAAQHGWLFTWRIGLKSKAMDSSGQLIAVVDSNETLRTVNIASGVDVCLIVLSLLGTDVLDYYERVH